MKPTRVLTAIALCVAGSPAFAQAQAGTAVGRDGSHDFDFNFGTWHTHIRRYTNVLEGAGRYVELDGTVVTHPLWGGKGAYEEIEADGPEGHWEGMTLFLYNPASGQWSQAFASSKVGVLQTATVGRLRNGRMELVAQDSLGGRSILVRGVWSDILPDSHTYTESYSDDAGTTWKPAFVGKLTRMKP